MSGNINGLEFNWYKFIEKNKVSFGFYKVFPHQALLMRVADSFIKLIYFFLFKICGFNKSINNRSNCFNCEKISTILILEPYGIGDAVVATSLIKSLREAFPGAHISALLHEKTRGLLDSTFDNVIYVNLPWTFSSGRYLLKNYFNKNFIEIIKRLRSFQYDIILDARCDFRLSLLMGILKGRIKVGFDYGLASYCYTNAVAYGKRLLRKSDYSKLLSAFNIQSSTCLPFIEIDEESEQVARVKELIDGLSYSYKEFFIVHPGASWEYRRWNIEKLSMLIKHIKAITELKLLIIGSYEDEKTIDIIINKVGGSKLILSLNILPYIIRYSRFIVCNNTGVMHIADALNVPALVIMGPTDRETWLPSREDFHLLFHKTDEYWCYPCNELICFNPDNPCIENVSVDEVIQTLSIAFQNGWANMKVSDLKC